MAELSKAQRDEIERGLRHLARCGDIPAYRRKQLFALVEFLTPLPYGNVNKVPEHFADPFYRRPGMFLRLRREDDPVLTTGGLRYLAGPEAGRALLQQGEKR